MSDGRLPPSDQAPERRPVREAVALRELGRALLHALLDGLSRRHVEAGHLALVADQRGDLLVSFCPLAAPPAAAAATRRLRLGTGICLVVERDPIVTAKEVATLDRLSGGRFIFGIGGGWNAEEMEHHGTSFKSRWRLLRERVLAMKEIWTKDEAEFHGEFVNFDRIWSLPKPLQKPHPPILMGGDGPTTFDRVVEFADGWMPLARSGRNPAEKIGLLRQRAEKAGRHPKSISVTIFFAKPEKVALEGLRAAGVERAIFGVPSEGRDSVLPLLDSYTRVMV